MGVLCNQQTSQWRSAYFHPNHRFGVSLFQAVRRRRQSGSNGGRLPIGGRLCSAAGRLAHHWSLLLLCIYIRINSPHRIDHMCVLDVYLWADNYCFPLCLWLQQRGTWVLLYLATATSAGHSSIFNAALLVDCEIFSKWKDYIPSWILISFHSSTSLLALPHPGTENWASLMDNYYHLTSCCQH